MPVVCVCVCVCPEWQLTGPHSWALWGASLCGDPAAGTLSLALLPPCRLALAVESKSEPFDSDEISGKKHGMEVSGREEDFKEDGERWHEW